jgi:hypothetical protein
MSGARAWITHGTAKSYRPGAGRGVQRPIYAVTDTFALHHQSAPIVSAANQITVASTYPRPGPKRDIRTKRIDVLEDLSAPPNPGDLLTLVTSRCDTPPSRTDPASTRAPQTRSRGATIPTGDGHRRTFEELRPTSANRDRSPSGALHSSLGRRVVGGGSGAIGVRHADREFTAPQDRRLLDCCGYTHRTIRALADPECQQCAH